MTLKKCILTANDCCKTGTKMTGGKPTGIVVHSTGANNKNIKRYVQPLESSSDYNEIIADLGKNKYANDWNRSAKEIGRSVCVHAFIGANAAGQVETYQTLPFDICCWGVGSGSKGSYNYNPTARVQFEMCEDDLTDEAYFNAVMKEAQEFCAYLCRMYGLTVDQISSHKESHAAGYGNNHGDPENWLTPFGKTMDWFRAEVQKQLDAGSSSTQPSQPEETGAAYFVQIGPYKEKSSAEAQLAKVKAAGFDAYVTTNVEGAAAPAPETPAAGFSVGDKVKCNAGVSKYSDGSAMASWVPSATLYVRQVESGGKILLVSAEPVKKVYTGRVNASDVHKI